MDDPQTSRGGRVIAPPIVCIPASAAIGLIMATHAAAAVCVDVSLRFDPLDPPPGVVEAMQRETTSIWAPYGVFIGWVTPTRRAPCDVAQGSFDVYVERGQESADAPTLVLGSTRVGRPVIDHVPVSIDSGSTERLLERMAASQVFRAVHHTAAGPEDLGRALGRILAHELGHVLLAVADHQAVGLMRPTFAPNELIRLERSSFGLSLAEVLRLRQRAVGLDAVRHALTRAAVSSSAALSGPVGQARGCEECSSVGGPPRKTGVAFPPE